MKRNKFIEWLVIAAIGCATLWLYHPHFKEHTLSDREFETVNLARSLAEHRGFADPFFSAPTGPSAHAAPLYPAYLASLMMLFGKDSTAAGNTAVWASLLMLAAITMILPLLANRLGLGFWSGVLAALAWIAAGIPPIFLEESTAAALLIVIAAYLMKVNPPAELSWKNVIASGVVWGLMLLLQPVGILILAAWLLLVHFRSRTSWRKKLAFAAIPLIMVAPWIARNFAVFHRPVFIRDNLGLELAVSNNDCATPLFEMNDESMCFESSHPNFNYEQAMKVREMGEVEYNKYRLKEALGWIKANPSRFVVLTGQRWKAFWFPPPALNKGNGMVWKPMLLNLFTLLSLPGLFLMWRNARPAAYVLLMWLALFPLIYYFIQFMDRYRYPIFWVTFLAGSYFVLEFAGALLGTTVLVRKPAEGFVRQS